MDEFRKWFDAKYPEVDQALASALFDVVEAVVPFDEYGKVADGNPRLSDEVAVASHRSSVDGDTMITLGHLRHLRAALDRLEEVRRDQ